MPRLTFYTSLWSVAGRKEAAFGEEITIPDKAVSMIVTLEGSENGEREQLQQWRQPVEAGRGEAVRSEAMEVDERDPGPGSCARGGSGRGPGGGADGAVSGCVLPDVKGGYWARGIYTDATGRPIRDDGSLVERPRRNG